MARREILRATWPLPWWVAAVPGLILGIVTYLIVSTAASWPYIAPARLSGMIGQSIGVTGPISCAASSWVAERFTNRHSPIAWPILRRAAGGQGFRALGVVCVSWVGLSALGGYVASFVVLRGATGGHFYPAETAIDCLGLTFFVVSGFAIGTVVGRWYGPIWALIWALIWIWVAPIYSGGLFPYPSKNVEFFLFPGQIAVDHYSLDGRVMVAILGWWMVVIGSVLLLMWIWLRANSRAVAWPLVIVGAFGPILVAVIGVSLAHVLPSPFLKPVPQRAVCVTKARVQYCVTREQRDLLGEFVAAVSPSVRRMGSAWPPEIHRVVSFSIAGEGTTPPHSDLGVDVTSASGIPDAAMDIGAGLGGLDSCDSGRSDPIAVAWAFDFARWLSKSPDGGSSSDARSAALRRSSDTQVQAWYIKNATDLLACRYTGPGPGMS